MSKLVTFDSVQNDGTINLGIGQPSSDLLPLDLIKTATNAFLDEAIPQDLNYGETAGDEGFLNSLADFLSKQYSSPVDPQTLFLSGGNSQALDFVCANLSKPGDTIFVEEPTYFLAAQIFRDNHLNIVGIPTDENGMNIDRLEEELKKTKPTLLYTIPVYHNPGGQTLSDERRKRLVELSKEYGFYIVADEVYQMLNYYEAPPKAMGTMTDSGTILSLGSFSKILAPGLRLGWIQTSKELVEKIGHAGVINSGGCPNHFTSLMVKKAIDMGLLDQHIVKTKNSYRAKLEMMEATLQEHFSDIATWYCPRGGYFFWIKMNDESDTITLKEKAKELQTGFQAGELFSYKGELKDYIRLSFASYSESEIKDGVTRLRSVFK